MSTITNHPKAPDIESSTNDYKTRFSGETGEWFLEIQSQNTTNFIASYFGKTRARVLDVGGGHGQNIQTINSLGGPKLTILSSKGASLEVIQEYVAKELVELILVDDLLSLKQLKKQYDVVLSYRTLAHLDNWEDFIKRLCSLSDKMVIVDYPILYSSNCLIHALFFIKKKVEKNTRRYRLFKIKEIEIEFRKNGFVPVYRNGQFILPMALHRMISSRAISEGLERVLAAFWIPKLFATPVIQAFVKEGDCD